MEAKRRNPKTKAQETRQPKSKKLKTLESSSPQTEEKMNSCLSLATKVLLDQIEKDGNKNVVTSPLSLNLVLNMLAAGSQGRTLEQLLGALGAKSVDELNLASSKMMALIAVPNNSEETSLKKRKDDGGPILSIVNGVWVDRKFPLKASFQEIAKNFYKADARAVDFANKATQTVEEVNSWVKDGTKGLITGMLSPTCVTCDTIVILANALYFKGAWENAFKKSITRDENFYPLNGKTIKVPFMTSNKDEEHFYGSFDGYQLLQLPYRCGDDEDNKQFSMYVFLPEERTGLENLLQKFNSEPSLLHQQCNGLRKRELSKMWLPKFKFSYQFKPSETMKELGINLPFECPGELTEMVDCVHSELVYVSDIIQESFIETNEEGTEAAAATIAKMMKCLSRRRKDLAPSFVADHPFVFMIKEDVSGMVFFTGAVVNPRLSN